MSSHTDLPIERLPDDVLLDEVTRSAAAERRATVRLIALLGELDARRLYLAQGCSSLFTYCTRVLRLSEHAAYSRIEAARAARRFPAILALLEEGAITLTTIVLLAPHLTPGNHAAVLDSARGRSKREVEAIVAHLRPRPDVPSAVRKLPSIPAAGTAAAESSNVVSDPPVPPESEKSCVPIRPADRPLVAPLAPERYRIQLTIGRATHERLRRAQDLQRHAVPDGDPAVIFDRALTLLVEHLERVKLGAAKRPRAGRSVGKDSRRIPSAVKRAVWTRDEGRCAFVGPCGRCEETGFLEFHHVRPYADGGQATVENVSLRCKAHNQHEAERWFGPLLVRESRPGYSVRTESAM